MSEAARAQAVGPKGTRSDRCLDHVPCERRSGHEDGRSGTELDWPDSGKLSTVAFFTRARRVCVSGVSSSGAQLIVPLPGGGEPSTSYKASLHPGTKARLPSLRSESSSLCPLEDHNRQCTGVTARVPARPGVWVFIDVITVLMRHWPSPAQPTLILPSAYS